MSIDGSLREERTVVDIQKAAERVKADGKSKPRAGRHPVNQPMVDHWLDAIGDK
ncbi:MAG: 3-oxo-4,17-pregnadiene-20-carboxyl-CoA hydratase alpha subunit, partial [Mycobacterium sp.]|nr:3-oxo-4,17-pregnadiene-20-carboxyl-CoA hydratase alpha subunit [Mycobacterium sp.]